ncbi:putative cobalamin-independent methionine synthase MetE, UROD/MetE-like superfamily [Helianthus annuus]|uniref:Putative cobalamin-independent methionine synthase MetE n=1 Tax=Helianthus annuus TaxID=4232 RepID=A0A251VJ72_HELAN|nr:putative cobalamin-independent methionine synthase MetE, UROD/MetE-like superfamily [Helianthus annuus]KAJ0472338.1 putative cobalamin-independent methionine synthase MetE, UROD/MetE-like superfamily [Helianthus annuus]KAJ0619937.1 putative cobalamin-independent methionine synthase MetE, UROD/MetE-like superfamily [Helianthus annuus]KAJ0647935.1 putative cobalamin-independent methionine synthase MetE, UROD/MetE-like superfamily [Helianthus annuus]
MMINLYSNSTASSSSIASIGSRIRVNYKLVIVTALNPNSFSVAFSGISHCWISTYGPQERAEIALESFWDGKSTAEDLQKVAADLRSSIWKQMSDAGIKYISSNTFSYYDQVLDTTAMLGAVPARYN